MAAYKVNIDPQALRDLKQLERPARKAVKEMIDALADDPRPPGVKPLKGHRPYLRVRSGDYRAVYLVDDTAREVRVAIAGHRCDVYEIVRRRL